MIKIIKTLYGFFLWFVAFFHLKKRITTNYNYTIYASNKRHTFFGYYDKTPFNDAGNVILAQATDMKNIPLKKPYFAEIGYFKIENPTKFIPVGQTDTWCWQQGARLMWFPHTENKLIIYNKIINNKYASVIQDVYSKKIIKQLDFPIYDIDSSGKYAATLNFSRLGMLRPGYGYVNFPKQAVTDLSEDGVWICDLKLNTKKQILTLKDLAKSKPNKNDIKMKHYVNHLSFNPLGDKLLFYYIRTFGKKRIINAYVCNLDGKDLVLLNEGRNCSHYVWKNDDILLMFSENINGYSYNLHNTQNGNIIPLIPVMIEHDGHPSFYDENSIIADTYPLGFFKEQSLFSHQFYEKVNKIAKICTPYSYKNEERCDLHPRLSKDKRKVCIDVPTLKGRKMVVFNVDL